MEKSFGLVPNRAPMEARSAKALPDERGKWQYEPKWDGFRCLVFKEASAAELRGKSGKALGRFFPEVIALLRDLPVERFVADGELVIEIDGRLSFDALQMRLHPAESRIRKLAAETPARLVLFDMLMSSDGEDMTGAPFAERRRALEAFGRPAFSLPRSPTRSRRPKGGSLAMAARTGSSPSGSIDRTRAANGRWSRSNG
jgi:ATP-dependent DNA ligase